MTTNPGFRKVEPETMDVPGDVDICSLILQSMEKLYNIKDLNALLDAVLLQARQLIRSGVVEDDSFLNLVSSLQPEQIRACTYGQQFLVQRCT